MVVSKLKLSTSGRRRRCFPSLVVVPCNIVAPPLPLSVFIFAVAPSELPFLLLDAIPISPTSKSNPPRPRLPSASKLEPRSSSRPIEAFRLNVLPVVKMNDDAEEAKE